MIPTYDEAACRETLEEAGIGITLKGIVRVEYTPMAGGTARCRVVFLASPSDDASLKSVPDEESLGAGWFTLSEMGTLPLRGREVLDLFRYLEGSPLIAPLSLLADEGQPYP